ncbi:MAG: hypothetical protein BGO90_04405 [Legionella sp. 40-6]|nr:hypothetical protein [Legionella sp.]OJY41547.1 MAG: hypothetical protein BGO90_04405 [Legionella sp. 40-6]
MHDIPQEERERSILRFIINESKSLRDASVILYAHQGAQALLFFHVFVNCANMIRIIPALFFVFTL